MGSNSLTFGIFCSTGNDSTNSMVLCEISGYCSRIFNCIYTLFSTKKHRYSMIERNSFNNAGSTSFLFLAVGANVNDAATARILCE
jgi:hypothetical protein